MQPYQWEEATSHGEKANTLGMREHRLVQTLNYQIPRNTSTPSASQLENNTQTNDRSN